MYTLCIYNIEQGGMYIMRVSIRKWGNSLALRIPKLFAVEAHIQQGSTVDISLKDGKIIAVPVSEKKYSLDDLLLGVTEKNIHKEFNTGQAVGLEAW